MHGIHTDLRRGATVGAPVSVDWSASCASVDSSIDAAGQFGPGSGADRTFCWAHRESLLRKRAGKRRERGRTLASLRKPNFTADPTIVAQEALVRGFTELPIVWRAAAAVAKLPPIHRDPFGRILVAQAVAEPVHLLTADPALLPYSDMVRLARVR